MRSLPSIRERLSTVLVLMSLLWGLAVSAVVWLTVRHEVDELLDQTLQESAEILYGLLVLNMPTASYSEQLPAPAHDERLVWQVVAPGPRVLLRSHQAPTLPLASRRDSGFANTDEHWRVYALPFAGSDRMLYVAQRGSERREARLEAAGLTAGAALLVGLLCALGLRLRVRRELAPIDVLSAAVAHFEPAPDGASLQAASRAELLPMQDAINGLAARLAKRLANERAFSAHAAHALRTPLAGVVAQLAVAQRLSPPEAQPQLQRARSAADRLRRVVTALLALFRSGSEVQWQRVDLAELAAHLPFDGLELRTEGPCALDADPDLLVAALLNLLDNAHRHAATRVTLRVHRRAGGDEVHVSDNGSGMAPALRLQLQAALETQSYDGEVGLGLMLADLVARAHGGHLQLPASAGGCDIVLGPFVAPGRPHESEHS